MMNKNQQLIITFLGIILIFNIISLMLLYSSLHRGGEFYGKTVFYKQILWIFIFWIVLFLFSRINYYLYYHLVWIIYIICILSLLVVHFIGKEAMGAQRWVSLGFLNFQPSELAKLVIIFTSARIFSQISKDNHKDSRCFFKTLVLTSLLCLLIFKQPDLGTALVVFLIFLMVATAAPVRKQFILLVIISGVVITPFAWKLLKDYQKKRLIVFLNPNIDPLGAGYTIIQSKIAIGSGKILGKGFLSGTQNQFNFLPERHTDFIFTVLAEEFGFLGSIFLFILYYLLLQIILAQAKKSSDPFAQYLCIGIFSYFFLHIVINIGMTMGVFPVVGLPLLLVSYGGTHLLMSAIICGVFINISIYS